MSTTTSSPSDIQPSVDLRLDAIDRALLGVLSRHDRIEIVARIETKIRESAGAAADRESGSLGRGRPDRFDDAPIGTRPRRRKIRHRSRSRLAVSSGVLGIVSLTLLAALPLVYIAVATLLPDEMIVLTALGGHATTAAFGGLLAVVLGIVALVMLNRRGSDLTGHGWAITGLCTGPLPLVLGGLWLLVMQAYMSSMSPAAGTYTASTIPPPGPCVVTSVSETPQTVSAPGYAAPSFVPAPSSPPGVNPYAEPATMPPMAASPGPVADVSDLPAGEPAESTVDEPAPATADRSPRLSDADANPSENGEVLSR